MSDLLQLRGEIDRIDREIVRLFEQRMEVTDEVGRYKIENGKKVFDREREREKIETVKGLVEGDFNKHAVAELFEQLMKGECIRVPVDEQIVL